MIQDLLLPYFPVFLFSPTPYPPQFVIVPSPFVFVYKNCWYHPRPTAQPAETSLEPAPIANVPPTLAPAPATSSTPATSLAPGKSSAFLNLFTMHDLVSSDSEADLDARVPPTNRDPDDEDSSEDSSCVDAAYSYGHDVDSDGLKQPWRRLQLPDGKLLGEKDFATSVDEVSCCAKWLDGDVREIQGLSQPSGVAKASVLPKASGVPEASGVPRKRQRERQ